MLTDTRIKAAQPKGKAYKLADSGVQIVAEQQRECHGSFN